MTLDFCLCMTRDDIVRFINSIIMVLLLTALMPTHIYAQQAPPDIWLPTPPDEEWDVIQGFYCGTHGDNRKLDLSRVSGSTQGAPIYAAASGTVHFWTSSSGTLILSHGNGYYTEYTHIRNPVTTASGVFIEQGEVVGYVNGYGHLDFSLYYSPGGYYYSRTTLPLTFQDGYTFPETSGCNQHYGRVVIAHENGDDIAPTVEFTSDAEPGEWYSDDKRIDFAITDDRIVQGFSQAFDKEPAGDTPEFEDDAGYVQLASAGEGLHTLNIRAWDSSDNQTYATFGPVGYDVTAPTFALSDTVTTQTYSPAASGSISLQWQPANDGKGSGIAGYTFYLGPDDTGTSDRYSDENVAVVKNTQPGCYFLRLQAVDHAGHTSAWQTVQHVVVLDEDSDPPDRCPFAVEQQPIEQQGPRSLLDTTNADAEDSSPSPEPKPTLDATVPVSTEETLTTSSFPEPVEGGKLTPEPTTPEPMMPAPTTPEPTMPEPSIQTTKPTTITETPTTPVPPTPTTPAPTPSSFPSTNSRNDTTPVPTMPVPVTHTHTVTNTHTDGEQGQDSYTYERLVKP